MKVECVLTHRKDWEAGLKQPAIYLAQLLKHRQANEWTTLLQSINEPRPKTVVSLFGKYFDALLRSFILSISRFEFMYCACNHIEIKLFDVFVA